MKLKIKIPLGSLKMRSRETAAMERVGKRIRVRPGRSSIGRTADGMRLKKDTPIPVDEYLGELPAGAAKVLAQEDAKGRLEKLAPAFKSYATGTGKGETAIQRVASCTRRGDYVGALVVVSQFMGLQKGAELRPRVGRLIMKGAGHKYVRRVKKPGGGWRYYYSDAAIAHRATEGERINLGDGKLRDVLDLKDGKLTLRDPKTGKTERITVSELHDRLHAAYRDRMEAGAERMVRRFRSVVSRLPKHDTSKPESTWKAYADRFKAAKVDPEHAKQLVGYLARRDKWDNDARDALLVMASDPKFAPAVTGAERQIAEGAENLRDASKPGTNVTAQHVAQAVQLRTPGKGQRTPGDKVQATRVKAAAELAKAEALLGAVEASGQDSAILAYAKGAVSWSALAELEEAAKAFPGLRDLEELQRFREVKGRWQAATAPTAPPQDGGLGIPGAETTVYVANKNGGASPQTARYRVVEAAELIPSHDPSTTGFAERKDYPPGIQTRAYHKSNTEREKVLTNAKTMAVDLFNNTNPDAANGPPLITGEGIVLGGNSRTMSLQAAYANMPEAADKYRKHLAANARTFGLDPEHVHGMRNPVLVRVVETESNDPKHLGQLVQRYNEVFTASLDPRRDQVARARFVNSRMLSTLASGLDIKKKDGTLAYGTLNEYLASSDAKTFVASLQHAGIIDRRNRDQYLRPDGKLNQDGRTFVERILVGKVIPHPDTLSNMPLPQMNAVARSVPHIVRANEAGHDLTEFMREAIQVHTRMRAEGKKTLSEYEAQGEFGKVDAAAGFGSRPEISPMGQKILEEVLLKRGGVNQMSDFFRRFAIHARRNPAGQGGLFGANKTTEQLLDETINPPKAEQKGLDFSKGGASVVIDPDLYIKSLVARGYVEISADKAETLWKAAGHKYIKRVPVMRKVNGEMKRRYKYFYHVQRGGGVHNREDFVEGAAFQGDKGHYHITMVKQPGEHGNKTGEVEYTIKHDESGARRRMTAAQLQAFLEKQHAQKLKEHKEKLTEDLKEAMRYGTKKQRDRIKREAARLGWELEVKLEPGGVAEVLKDDRGLVAVRLKDRNGNLVTRWVKPGTLAWIREWGVTEWNDVGGKGSGITEEEARDVGIKFTEPLLYPEPLGPERPPKQYNIREEEAFKVSEDRPPNFLGVKLSAFSTKTSPSGYGGDDYKIIREDHPDLEAMGFFDAMYNEKAIAKGKDPWWGLNFWLSMVGRKEGWDRLSEGRRKWLAGVLRNLTSWWTDIRDDERRAFWDKYVDVESQAATGRVTRPEHENAKFSVPKGMEKFTARGYDFHEYQRKAVNFAADHAPRALLAMEMGLGKTLTAVGLFHELKNRGEVKQMLITAPLSAHGSWEDHFSEFSDAKVKILTGASTAQRRKAYKEFQAGKIDVLVMSPLTPSLKYKAAPMNAKELDKATNGMRLNMGGTMLQRTESGEWREVYRDGELGQPWTSSELVSEAKSQEERWLNAARYTRGRMPPKPKFEWTPPDGDYALLHQITHSRGEEILRIADEVHQFKDPKAAKTQGFWNVMSKAPGRVVGMTGTPKPNKADDFYHIMNHLKPGVLGDSLKEFGERYGYVGGFTGNEVTGFRPEKLKDLWEDASEIMFARTTADPDSELNLPPRIDVAPRIQLDEVQQKLERKLIYYMELRARARMEERAGRNKPGGGVSHARIQLQEAQRDDNPDPIDRAAARGAPAVPQVALLRWQQVAIDPSMLDELWDRDMPDYETPKLATIADATMDHLKQPHKPNAVLFCEYTGGILAMREALIKRGLKPEQIGIWKGDTSTKKKRELERAINKEGKGSIRVLIGNTKSLETGANLQKRASFVGHINTSWDPARLAQSTARVHRQGQSQKVTVFRPIGSHVEELIEGVVSRKLLQASQAIGRTMQADASIAASVRKYGKASLTKDHIAKVLGINTDVFLKPGEKPYNPEEVDEDAELEELLKEAEIDE